MFWLRNKNALKDLVELIMIAQGGATFIVSGNKPEVKIINASKYGIQGSQRNSKTQFHDFSTINNVISMTI